MNEQFIEADILEFLEKNWVHAEKITNEGFFDQNKKIFRRRKSAFSRNGTADIHATIPPYGRALYIEVKTPKEINFFDRPIDELKKRLQKAKVANPNKYIHAIEQRKYLDEKIKLGAVAFFASSVADVKKKLVEFGVEVT